MEEKKDLLAVSRRPITVAIDCCNWPDQFPYTPKAGASLRLSDNGKELIVSYRVEEATTAALTEKDNGEVWTDSCCELFIDPTDPEAAGLPLSERGYYNIECNAAGRLLIGWRGRRGEHTQHAPQEVLATVERRPSLGSQPFAEKAAGAWTLELHIPATALFRHDFPTWDGLRCRMNLYKCGDNLQSPHFLSHAPITGQPQPCFHLPEFFRPASFAL